MTDVVLYLREHGPQQLGLSHTDVNALYDLTSAVTDQIAQPVAMMNAAMDARSLTDIMACLGHSTDAAAAASGLQTLPSAWRDGIARHLCGALLSHTDPASNAEAMRAQSPQHLASRFTEEIGMADGQCTKTTALHALPYALQRSITKGLIARAHAWAQAFALGQSHEHPDRYEAAFRHAALALAPASLALIDRIPPAERDPLLNAMHLLLINNHLPAQDGTVLDDASWDIFSERLARNAVDDAPMRPTILTMYGPFTAHERACLLHHVTLIGLPRTELPAIELAPCFGASSEEASSAIADAMILYNFGHVLD